MFSHSACVCLTMTYKWCAVYKESRISLRWDPDKSIIATNVQGIKLGILENSSVKCLILVDFFFCSPTLKQPPPTAFPPRLDFWTCGRPRGPAFLPSPHSSLFFPSPSSSPSLLFPPLAAVPLAHPCSATPFPSPLFCGFSLSPILSITTCTGWSRSLLSVQRRSGVAL